MFQPIHPRYQTLRRRPDAGRVIADWLRNEDRGLSDIYTRIDDDLSEL